MQLLRSLYESKQYVIEIIGKDDNINLICLQLDITPEHSKIQ